MINLRLLDLRKYQRFRHHDRLLRLLKRRLIIGLLQLQHRQVIVVYCLPYLSRITLTISRLLVTP